MSRRPQPDQKVAARDPAGVDFDQVYFERVISAVVAAVNMVSTAPISGAVDMKPTEVTLALASVSGRLFGLAEQELGIVVTDEMLDALRQQAAYQLDRMRETTKALPEAALSRAPEFDHPQSHH